MRNQQEIDAIIGDVRRQLVVENDELGVALQVPDDGHVADDKWLTIVVTPSTAGVRASQYAEALGEVEHDLRAMEVSDVILVRAIVWD